MTLYHGDCLEVMKTFPDNHFTAIVTDPPYGLKFMGKKWDHGVPCIEYWKEALRISQPGTWLLAFGGPKTYHRLTCSIEDAGWEIRDCIMWMYGSGFPKSKGCLKPAYEPILLARKAASLPKLNIEKCRIPTFAKSFSDKRFCKSNEVYGKFNPYDYDGSLGRWPTNIILDEEAAQMLDECGGLMPNKEHDDKGGTSRFFYCAKASPSERKEGFHPTVKPLKLMKYLITLVTPNDNNLMLDPFAGSGTTLVAAKELGIDCVGIEKEETYIEIIKRRTQ